MTKEDIELKLRDRLQLLGYHHTRVESALRAFQQDFRIKDASPTKELTIRRLKLLTSSGNLQRELLARVIHSETRGEPFRGKVAVGAVVLNRVHSRQFPNSLMQVITQPLAFAVIADGSFWLEPNKQAYIAADEALRGIDPTGKCCYFFNPKTSTSRWIRRLHPKMQIGRHIFA